MNHLLVATDFSDNALNALQYGLEIAQKFNSAITILCVAQKVRGSAGSFRSIHHIIEEEIQSSLNELKEQLNALETYKNLTIHYVVKSGNPSEQIVHYAQQINANVTLVGAKGLSNLEAIFIGSVAISVVEKSKLPVMVIPQNAFFSGFKKLGLGVDLLPLNAEVTLKPLREIAQAYNAAVGLFHMIKSDKEITDEQLTEAQNLKDYLNPIPNELYLRTGNDIVEALDNFVTDNQIDLLVLVSRKYRLIQSLFHRSVTHRMAKNAKMPFLAIQE